MIEELYEEHSNSLRGFAVTKTGDPDLADEILQETFARALTNLELLRMLPGHKRRAWLFTTLRNAVTDHYRILGSRRSYAVEMEGDEPSIEPETGVSVRELADLLPDVLRDVVFKRFWLGMTSHEIAGQLGIPPGTVRYRLHKAVSMLRERMRE